MLTSNLGWVTPGYKPRLKKTETEKSATKQEEQTIQPSESIVTGENKTLHRRPFAANQNRSISSSSSDVKNERRAIIPRTKSAPPRSRTRTGNSSPKVVPEDDSTSLQASGNVLYTSNNRRSSVTKSVQDSINIYSQQMVPRTVENAAFRHSRAGSGNQNSGSRPSSGRMPATTTRPLGKCRKAWVSNNDLWQPAFPPGPIGRPGTPQSDQSEDEIVYAGGMKSDVSFQDNDRFPLPPGNEDGTTARPRPSSSCEKSNRVEFTEYLRSTSACSYRSKSPCHASRPLTPEDCLSPWMEDPRIGLSIGFNQDPTLVYFNRHSRCHDHNHLHHPLLLWRPQPACDSSVDTCGKFETGNRPDSAMSMRSFIKRSGQNDGVQRYINSHRPRTAPNTRRELQKFGATSQRGYLPHYCNFVRTKAIHDRPAAKLSTTDDITVYDDDDVDDGYITNTELSPTEIDGAEKKLPKKKSAGGKGESQADDERIDSAILRAGSPGGSTGYDPETLFDRLRQDGLAGSSSALNDSQIDDDALASPRHVNFDLQIEIKDGGASRDVTTQTLSTGRDPIQIPSTDDITKYNDVTDSSAKDITDIFKELTSDKVKEVKAHKTPTAAVIGKAKRAPCVKKAKMPGKERKKKGKKKEKSEDSAEAPPTTEITQVSEQADGTLATKEGDQVIVEVKVPDLPSIDSGNKEKTKSKRKKAGRKQIIAPSAPSDKAAQDTAPVSEEPKRGFYDFAGLIDTNTMAEDTTLSKPPLKVPSYLNDRMVLSLQSSRFELPMDMRSLEKMTPEEYLRKHCIVSSRRKTLYHKMFQKYRDKTGIVQGKNLNNCLKDVLVNTISNEQVMELRRLLDIGDESNIDFQFFCGIAALAERILYPHFVTEDTADRTEYHREKVECADFCSLDWKLDGVQVSKHIRQLLESIS